jgi:hypothetical protein
LPPPALPYFRCFFAGEVHATVFDVTIDSTSLSLLRTLGADRAKPDLLVHQPGYMNGNHAIIEVKSSEAAVDGIKQDLETLSLFISKVRYQRAIYFT